MSDTLFTDEITKCAEEIDELRSVLRDLVSAYHGQYVRLNGDYLENAETRELYQKAESLSK